MRTDNDILMKCMIMLKFITTIASCAVVSVCLDVQAGRTKDTPVELCCVENKKTLDIILDGSDMECPNNISKPRVLQLIAEFMKNQIFSLYANKSVINIRRL